MKIYTKSGIFAKRYGLPDEICWLSPTDASIWAFAGPALVILIANLILMLTIVWVIWHLEYHEDNPIPKKIRISLRSLIFLYPIMGSSWLFGLFSFSHHSPYVYQYLFAFTNAFQGLFLLVFHCLLQTG